MALALIVERNCPDDIHDDTSRLFFYVGGIAALTLVSESLPCSCCSDCIVRNVSILSNYLTVGG
jgi:hypothetical protein